MQQNDHADCLATIHSLRAQLAERNKCLRENAQKTEALKQQYVRIIERLLDEREVINTDHVRKWMQMSGEANDIINLHDDTVADKLSKMKIFYRDRLQTLESRNKELTERLARYEGNP